jgi:hypothetical protein
MSSVRSSGLRRDKCFGLRSDGSKDEWTIVARIGLVSLAFQGDTALLRLGASQVEDRGDHWLFEAITIRALGGGTIS